MVTVHWSHIWVVVGGGGGGGGGNLIASVHTNSVTYSLAEQNLGSSQEAIPYHKPLWVII